MGKSYYEVLGVSEQAPQSEIARRFRVLALAHQPQLKAPGQAA